jgi:hypothetical protein
MVFTDNQLSLPVSGYFPGVYFHRTAVYQRHCRYLFPFLSPLPLLPPFPLKTQLLYGQFFQFPLQVEKNIMDLFNNPVGY